MTANLCYRAVLEAIDNAEAMDRFQFIAERDVFEFEHWPLERRKIEEQSGAREQAAPAPRRGGDRRRQRHWQGRGTAFAEEGAHVVVADLDGAVAEAWRPRSRRAPGPRHRRGVDVRDDDSLDALFRQTVLEFGGLDCLFYTAGRPPRFAPSPRSGARIFSGSSTSTISVPSPAIGRAATVMQRQELGGSIVASVSKAALAPGRDAAAYGGSKAALLQALRVAAVELGADGIRVNAINADQVETPLFLRFVRERAAMRGVSWRNSSRRIASGT